MSNEQILSSYYRVNGPSYRGATVPTFDKLAINEANFADELREKDSYFTILDDGNVKIKWLSQESTSDVDSFETEISRWASEIRNNEEWDHSRIVNIMVNLSSRDGYFIKEFDVIV